MWCKDSNIPHTSEYHEKINKITLAFRLNFSTHSLEKFACSAIGNLEDYTINLHVLDIGCE